MSETTAFEKATEALNQINIHEAVCAERYTNITEKLSQIPDILKSIGELKGLANKAIGWGAGISTLSIVVGVIYTAIKLTKGI